MELKRCMWFLQKCVGSMEGGLDEVEGNQAVEVEYGRNVREVYGEVWECPEISRKISHNRSD